jgi:hypothetical protein
MLTRFWYCKQVLERYITGILLDVNNWNLHLILFDIKLFT